MLGINHRGTVWPRSIIVNNIKLIERFGLRYIDARESPYRDLLSRVRFVRRFACGEIYRQRDIANHSFVIRNCNDEIPFMRARAKSAPRPAAL